VQRCKVALTRLDFTERAKFLASFLQIEVAPWPYRIKYSSDLFVAFHSLFSVQCDLKKPVMIYEVQISQFTNSNELELVVQALYIAFSYFSLNVRPSLLYDVHVNP
jgi:hypothetical protein